MALRKPTFCPATYTNGTETTTISRNGAHQAALRRRSVKVLDGAMNALMMRAPSESGAGWETGDLGKTGAVAICLLRSSMEFYSVGCMETSDDEVKISACRM